MLPRKSIGELLVEWARAFIPLRYHYPIRQFSYDVRSLAYRGDTVYCPWCRGSFRTFLQYGVPIHPHLNTYCPRCNAFERHRLLRIYFEDRTQLLQTPCDLLHIAPEYMIQRAFRAIHGARYVSVDYDSSLAMMHADLTALPFSDDRFDFILCSHVLEHIPADRQAMAELFRVLRPGGWAMLPVPLDWTRADTLEDPRIIDPRERARVFGQSDHVRLYGRDYLERLAGVGFQVRVEAYAATLGPEVVARLGINVRERLIIGVKASA